jgi:excisionase family DNA binding protein
MNINGFRRWLKAQIVMFDDDTECAGARADETVPTIREAEQIALKMGLPEIARHCATVTTTLLALPVAQEVLSECMAMLQSKTPYFDSTAAADYLGVTEKSLYGLVERKRLTPLRGPRRTYRFTREQLDHYLAENSKLHL